MTIESLRCAVCGEPVSLDVDHVEIQGEHLPRTEFDNLDEFVAHTDCWRRATADWDAPY